MKRLWSVALGLVLLAPAPRLVLAGILDTPLPTFSTGHAAVRVAVIPALTSNNQVRSLVTCTNIGPGGVDIGLEVFDASGALANSIAAGNGAAVNVPVGATTTISGGATALFHEDVTLALGALVALANGSGRVV